MTRLRNTNVPETMLDGLYIQCIGVNVHLVATREYIWAWNSLHNSELIRSHICWLEVYEGRPQFRLYVLRMTVLDWSSDLPLGAYCNAELRPRNNLKGPLLLAAWGAADRSAKGKTHRCCPEFFLHCQRSCSLAPFKSAAAERLAMWFSHTKWNLDTLLSINAVSRRTALTIDKRYH
jgi:hypothetical protein